MKPRAIVMREKDMDDVNFERIAERCFDECRLNDVDFFISHNIAIAQKIKCPNLHLSFADFERIQDGKDCCDALEASKNVAKSSTYHEVVFDDKDYNSKVSGASNLKESFEQISVAVHSLEEALRAETLGADRIVFGHVFETDCKKGAPPRGLEIVKDIANMLSIPLWAIGGITVENFRKVIEAGAEDVCVMSGAMRLPLEQIKMFFE